MTVNGAICGFLLMLFAAVAVSAGEGADGIDPSFGQGGETTVQPDRGCASGCVESFGSHAQDVALASDGSIVLAGSGSGGGGIGQGAWLARLEADGTLDPTFGPGGYAEGQRGLTMSRVFVANDGAAVTLVSGPAGGSLGLERFTPAGAVDASFGNSGVRWLRVPLQGQVESLFDKQGRIVVLGEATVDGGPMVARFLPSGQPDVRFGRDGVARVGPLGEAAPLRLATEPSGAIVVAGAGLSGAGPGPPRTLLARLTASGAADRSFGLRGVVRVLRAFPGRLDALAVAPDHGIFLASSAHHRNGTQGTDELLVARCTHRGPDRSFGVRGVSQRTLPAGRGAGLMLQAMTVDAGGDAVLVGEHRGHSVDVPRGTWFIARYTRHGRDCSFGDRGSVEGMEGGANAVAIQSNQRIVIAGWGPGRLPDGAGTAFMAARYIGGSTSTTCPGE